MSPQLIRRSKTHICQELALTNYTQPVRELPLESTHLHLVAGIKDTDINTPNHVLKNPLAPLPHELILEVCD